MKTKVEKTFIIEDISVDITTKIKKVLGIPKLVHKWEVDDKDIHTLYIDDIIDGNVFTDYLESKANTILIKFEGV